ncbi:DUF1828 domain-containing protein [Aeromicrobium sp. CF4.19]|uniref:DUF1828 domain-containing protein n=1 Tax=Aeromicrobium sp. CF4.19 TaxID=3373082 RepID=UPI003EE4C200
MNVCEGPLSGVLRVITADLGWECEPLPDGRAIISTGRRYADSEPVEIYMAAHADMFDLSDGGETLSRLHAGGYDAEDAVHQAMWRDLLHEYRVSFSDGVVTSTATVQNAPHVLSRMADALLGLDALRVLAPPVVKRPRTFARAVEDYLREQFSDEAVEANRNVTFDGQTVRPSFTVTAKRGPIYVQAAATTSGHQGYEHAFFTFSMAAQAEVPFEQRLAILGGTRRSWTPSRLTVLAERANVALWEESGGELDAFLSGVKSKSGLLIPQTTLP